MADYTSMHRQYTYTELSRAKDRRVKQIDEFIKKGVGQNWDGVLTMTTK